MKIDFKDLENVEVDGVDSRDYPDFSDAYFSHATLNDIELTESELEQLDKDYPEKLSEMAYEYCL